MNAKTKLVCYEYKYNICENQYGLILSLGIGKTLYQIGMVFSAKAYNQVDNTVYSYAYTTLVWTHP